MTLQSTFAVANWFLDRGQEDGVPIDPLKLQKLLYYAHGWHLAVTGRPLLDECVEAWPYGPVVPSVYHEFKRFGNEPIRGRAKELVEGKVVEPRVLDPQTIQILEKVWREYKGFSGVQLSNASHAPNSPWSEARAKAEQAGKVRGVDIPDDEIRQYFYEAGRRHRSAYP